MSNNGHPGYDEKLLAAAPAVDKGMLQEGYTTDLLEKPKASPTPPPDLEAGRKQPPRSSQRNYSNPPPSSKPAPIPEKTPFFRTTKGILVIAIAFVVILAAVVGGAVGGTRKKSTKVDAQSSGHSAGPDTGSSSVSQSTIGPSGSTGPDIGPSTTSNTTSPTVTGGIGRPPTSQLFPTSFSTSIGVGPDVGGGNTGGGNPQPTPNPPPPFTQTSPDGGEPGETQGVGGFVESG